MKCYAVAELDVTDPRWVADYVANVTAIVERCGGRYLARTARIETWNQEPKPFVWIKTAEQILDSIATYCGRINESGH